jgi:hypothetical protein
MRYLMNTLVFDIIVLRHKRLASNFSVKVEANTSAPSELEGVMAAEGKGTVGYKQARSASARRWNERQTRL